MPAPLRLSYLCCLLITLSILTSCSGSDSNPVRQDLQCTEGESLCTNDLNQEGPNIGINDEDEPDAFALPQTIEIIPINSSEAKTTANKFDDTGTDYDKFVSSKWPAIPTLDTISLTNAYLCFLNQLNTKDFINEGIYKAEVDSNLCAFTTLHADKPETFLVNVTQASETDARFIDIWWLDVQIPSWPEILTGFLHIEISEGVSNDKPLGDWSIDYRFTNNKDSTFAESQTLFGGENGKSFILHHFEGPFYSVSQGITKTNSTSGTSHAIETSGESSENYNFTFDKNYLLDSFNQCKNLNNQEEHVNTMLIFESDTGNQFPADIDNTHFPAFYYEGETLRFANLSSLGVQLSEFDSIDTSIFHDGHPIERYEHNYIEGSYSATGELYTLTLPAPVIADENNMVSNFILENADSELHTFSPLAEFSYSHSDENDRLGNALYTDEIYFTGVGIFDTLGLNIKDGVSVGETGQYVLKAANIGIHYEDVSADNCSELNIGLSEITIPVLFFYELNMDIPEGTFSTSVINGETL